MAVSIIRVEAAVVDAVVAVVGVVALGVAVTDLFCIRSIKVDGGIGVIVSIVVEPFGVAVAVVVEGTAVL